MYNTGLEFSNVFYLKSGIKIGHQASKKSSMMPKNWAVVVEAVDAVISAALLASLTRGDFSFSLPFQT